MYIPTNVIEDKANKLLYEYFKNDGIKEIILPINPIDIAESYLGLTVDFDEIKENNNQKILGAIYINKKIIKINGKYEKEFEEKEGFLNFTCAHEIGHWILHVDENSTKQVEFKIKTEEKEKLICRDTMKKEPIEIQADMFAANLLMPSKLITSDIIDLKKSKKIEWVDLYKLKDKYKVTISALVSRVQSLKLIYINDKTIYNSIEEFNGQISLF